MFQEILDRFTTKFGPDAIAAYLSKIIPQLLSATLTALFFFLLWLSIRRVTRTLLERIGLDVTLQAFVQTLLRTFMGAVALVSALACPAACMRSDFTMASPVRSAKWPTF